MTTKGVHYNKKTKNLVLEKFLVLYVHHGGLL